MTTLNVKITDLLLALGNLIEAGDLYVDIKVEDENTIVLKGNKTLAEDIFPDQNDLII